jgi:hypothetical protein
MTIHGKKLLQCGTGKVLRTYKSHSAAVRANRAKWAKKKGKRKSS